MSDADEIDRDRIALGVRQPWAELIVRGVKTVEVRSRPTSVRGPIYIYAAKKWADHEFADAVAAEHGVTRDGATYGRLVGTVTLTDCRPVAGDDVPASLVPEEFARDAFAWVVDAPALLPEPLKPRFLPYGVWFYPFKRRPISSQKTGSV